MYSNRIKMQYNPLANDEDIFWPTRRFNYMSEDDEHFFFVVSIRSFKTYRFVRNLFKNAGIHYSTSFKLNGFNRPRVVLFTNSISSDGTSKEIQWMKSISLIIENSQDLDSILFKIDQKGATAEVISSSCFAVKKAFEKNPLNYLIDRI